MLRSGVIAKKDGMTRLFMKTASRSVTVLLFFRPLRQTQVVAQRTIRTGRNTAGQLGAGTARLKRTSQAMRGHFAAAS